MPAAFLAAGVAAGFAVPIVDRALGFEWDVVGQPEAARTFLGSIATLTMSVVGVAFSVTLVALQLASSQLSPRVLRTFRTDRLNQVTLGAFLAASVYALLVLRSVDTKPAFVPALGVAIALAATLACMALFVAFVDNIVRSLQPATIIGRIADAGRHLLDGLPERDDRDGTEVPADGTPSVIRSERSGSVDSVDEKGLARALADAGATARTSAVPGDLVVRGDPLLEIWGPVPEELEAKVHAAFEVEHERSPGSDVGFPLRQLADVALKGLSPSLNDVTTAVMAIERASDLLVQAAGCRIGPRTICDADGRPRLRMTEPTLDDLIRLTFEQVRGSVRGDVRIAVRILRRLDRIAWAAARQGIEAHEPQRQADMLVEAFEGDATARADTERVREARSAMSAA